MPYRTKEIIFLLISLPLLFMACNTGNMEREIHYIPDNFIGKIRINFEHANGEDKEFLDGARVYRIPKSGVLNTKFNTNTGWILDSEILQFYYVDNSNKPYRQLKHSLFIDSSNQIHSNEIGISQFVYIGTTVSHQEAYFLEYTVDTIRKF